MLKSLDGKRRLLVSFAMILSLTAIVVTPALAITDGDADVPAHAYVGLMVAQDANGNPLWRCTGTLMSSTVFLTAGHCTAPDGADNPAHVEIWFSAGPIPRDPAYPSTGDATPTQFCDGVGGYPCTGDVGGTPYTIPSWNPAAFFVHDAGVVVLSSPYASSTYGALPAANSEDSWKTARGLAKVTFDSVGYGLQESFPVTSHNPDGALRIRLIAHPKLNQINGGIVGSFALLLSNNAHTGGTCFGDSGGPNFLAGTNTVAAVTSFGLNGNCAGTGGVFRMDRAESLAFVADATANGNSLSHYSGD